MATWKFRAMTPAEQNRNPNEGEFFRQESAIDSLVREAIQNSLDAAINPEAPRVRVRFALSGDDGAVDGEARATWLAGLPPHLVAAGVEKPAQLGAPIPFLTIEDFGTRGLTGSADAARRSELESTKNQDFFYFWRNVGITGKVAGTRGSWGLGKAVYPSLSRIRSFLGWTVRSDDNASLLMGQSVLGIHQRGQTQHDAFGFFAEFGEREGAEDFATASADPDLIAAFRNDFALARTIEHGTSLAILYPDKELCSDTSATEFAKSVLCHYPFPILQGSLSVDVATPQGMISINRDTVLGLPDELEWEKPADQRSTQAVLELAAWAIDARNPPIHLERDTAKKRAAWQDISFPGESLSDCRERFVAREPVGVRVPIHIRRREEPTHQESEFDVFLQQTEPGTPSIVHFVRQGLTISETPGLAGAGVAGLVVIDSTPLAQLLRAAENPAHTKWLSREVRLNDEYSGALSRVDFVVRAPRVLLKHYRDTEKDLDRDLLAEFFPEPDPDASVPVAKTGKKRGTRTPPPLINPPAPKPRSIRMEQIAGGFTVHRNPDVPLPGDELVIDLAFNCFGGDPFKAWEPFDFRVDRKPIELRVVEGTLLSKEGNRLTLTVDGDNFALDAHGFPPERDLCVRHRWTKRRVED